MPPTTCVDLLRTLSVDPGRPRVTWYGDDGERVELSGAVLENWVNKSTNLLVEEFDAAPGTRVLLDLPPHWRTVVWALAVWRAGACVVTPAADERPCDLTVTDEPGRQIGDVPLVVVSLPALSRHFDGALPPGAVDAASAVMTYGDVLGPVPAVDLYSPALVSDIDSETHGDLFRIPDTSLPATTQRTLHDVADRPLGTSLRTIVGVLGTGGSVVLVGGEYARDLHVDPERRARLIATERVTSEA